MCLTPKMHKKSYGTRFIIASKLRSTKQLSKLVFSIFTIIYNKIKNFHKKIKLLNNGNKFGHYEIVIVSLTQ